MPKPFSEEEKYQIKLKLLQAASDSMVQFGIKKTSIDELVRIVGISKGGFYLFYPSKESLIFDVIQTTQENIREDLKQVLLEKWDTPRELFVRFLEFLFNVFDEYPIMKIIAQPEEMSILMRSVPLERQQSEHKDDDDFFMTIFDEWKTRGLVSHIDSEVLAGIPRLVMALMLQKEMIGKDRFDDLMNLLISGLSKELEG
jgi:AcrR family transcriptional regulator